MKYHEMIATEAFFDRDDVLDRMRAEDPFFWCDHPAIGAWLVTGYDDVAALFRERRLEFGSTKGELLRQPEHERKELESVLRFMDNMFPVMPNARYKLVHGIWLQFFSPKIIGAFRHKLQECVKGILLDINPGEEADLSQAYSYPISASVMTSIIGVPDELKQDCIRWSKAIEALLWPYDYEKYKLANESLTAMIDCSRELLYQQGSAGPNLLSTLREAVLDGTITEDEATINCATTLFSGNELVAVGINSAIEFFGRHSHVLNSFINDSEQRAPILKELMRFEPALGWVRRTALESFSYQGKDIRKGDVVYLGTYAANHDPKYFDAPHVFNSRRKHSRPHLTFGAGVHSCTGAKLALLEIETALTTLFGHYPGLKLHKEAITRTPAMMLMNSISKLPATLTPSGR